MTEQAWVLRGDDGMYYVGGTAFGGGLIEASHFPDVHTAYHIAQKLTASMYHPFRAIPIERETVRKVEEIEGPAELYVLVQQMRGLFMRPDGGWSSDLQRARLFAPSDLYEREFSEGISIPVHVTKTPGEWKEVEQ